MIDGCDGEWDSMQCRNERFALQSQVITEVSFLLETSIYKYMQRVTKILIETAHEGHYFLSEITRNLFLRRLRPRRSPHESADPDANERGRQTRLARRFSRITYSLAVTYVTRHQALATCEIDVFISPRNGTTLFRQRSSTLERSISRSRTRQSRFPSRR